MKKLKFSSKLTSIGHARLRLQTLPLAAHRQLITIGGRFAHARCRDPRNLHVIRDRHLLVVAQKLGLVDVVNCDLRVELKKNKALC